MKGGREAEQGNGKKNLNYRIPWKMCLLQEEKTKFQILSKYSVKCWKQTLGEDWKIII